MFARELAAWQQTVIPNPSSERAVLIWNSLPFFVIRTHRPGFAEYFEQRSGKLLPENPEFHFRFWDTKEEWEYAIVEEKSGVSFVLPHYFGVAS
jgi:hypothetical protein